MMSSLRPDANVSHRMIVRLREPTVSTGGCHQKARSGLVRISNTKRFEHEGKKLRKELKFWIPFDASTDPICMEILERLRTESKEFDDPTECLEHIRSSAHKRIILILSDRYAENKKLAAEFATLSQIIAIYRCIPQATFDIWSKDRSFESQSFVQGLLPRRLIRTPIKQLDDASQLLLMQICLTELIVNLPRTDEAEQDFLHFCRTTFKDNASYMRQINEFQQTYDQSDAIRWYSRADSFVCRLVSTTCASMDVAALFQIRYILRDMYVQLQKLHEEQLNTFLRQDLVVYRGKMMSNDELNRLKNKGELFVTRNFLSTSMEEDVAGMFSGDGVRDDEEVSVLIAMHIDRVEMQEKPIAFIGEVSSMRFENEVMLPMGLVFRVASYEEVNSDARYSVKIKMVRGRDEKTIEKDLVRYGLLAEGMAMPLQSVKSGEFLEKYSNLISKLKSKEVNKQTSSVSSNSVQCDSTNPKAQPTTLSFVANMIAKLKQNPVYLVALCVGLLILVAAVVTPLALILSSKPSPMAAVCPRALCQTILSSDTNERTGWQMENIQLNCSHTLSNMTIELSVHRAYNETHVHQNQTFLDDTTEMACNCAERSPSLIYTWQSRPGKHITQESFPHFVQVQFKWSPGLIRRRQQDTWEVWFQSTCGELRNISGTF